MKRPKMIGAHVPMKSGPRSRVKLAESKAMVRPAFEAWTRRPGRTHLVRTRYFESPQP